MYYRWYYSYPQAKKEGHLQDGFIPDTLLLYLLVTHDLSVLSRMLDLSPVHSA